jgi:hypothetical protein
MVKIREAQAAGAVTNEIAADHIYILILRLSMAQLDQARLDRKSRGGCARHWSSPYDA